MDAKSLQELQAKDAERWAQLTSHLDAHPEGRVHGDDADPWTSAGVYTHLARWLDNSAAQLEAARDGRPAPGIDGTIDEQNTRWREADAAASLPEARERAFAAHGRYLAAVAALPLERWTDQLERTAVADGWNHYDEHLKYIEAKQP